MKSKRPHKTTELTVEAAIRRGKFLVSYPSITLVIVWSMLGLILRVPGLIEDETLIWFLIPNLILGILYWSFTVTKWRIWAFTNVRNVHELEAKARDANILPDEGSFTKHLQYWSKNDKVKWEKLKLKFKKKDLINRPVNYPDILKVYVYRPVVAFYFIMFLMVLCLIGYTIYEGNGTWYIFLAFFGIFYMTQDNFRKFISKKPRIILSEKGIETVEHRLYPWSEIKDVTIKKRGSGEHKEFHLEYRTPENFISISLKDLDIGVNELRDALRIYRKK